MDVLQKVNAWDLVAHSLFQRQFAGRISEASIPTSLLKIPQDHRQDADAAFLSPRQQPLRSLRYLLFKNSYSNATGSTSTATCTSFGSLIAPKLSLIALVSARICFPRATT
jgi:hypothetical protein